MEKLDEKKICFIICTNEEQQLEECYDESLLKGSCVIRLKGKRCVESEWDDDCLYAANTPKYEEVLLKAVPYCYWGNRKNGEMQVWMREEG